MKERKSTKVQRVSKYRRHSTGQALVEISGKRHYLGRYGSEESLERYKRVIARWEASGHQGVHDEPREHLSMLLLVDRLRQGTTSKITLATTPLGVTKVALSVVFALTWVDGFATTTISSPGLKTPGSTISASSVEASRYIPFTAHWSAPGLAFSVCVR